MWWTVIRSTVWAVNPPAASRPSQAVLQIACRAPLAVRTMVVVGGTVVVDVVELVAPGTGAVVGGGGGSVVAVVVDGGSVLEVAGAVGAAVVEEGAGPEMVGARVLELPADAGGSASTLGPDPRLAAQAQPAVTPAPARPASMARNRRRGRSGGLIGHTWSRSASVAQDPRWGAAPYPPPCGGWMVTDPEMTRGWRLSAARRQFRAQSRIAQSTLGGLGRLGVVW